MGVNGKDTCFEFGKKGWTDGFCGCGGWFHSSTQNNVSPLGSCSKWFWVMDIVFWEYCLGEYESDGAQPTDGYGWKEDETVYG